jgi:3-oxoacyl-[acyl-carrier protein] reductase
MSDIRKSLIPDLKGETAVVTGAGRGIGRAIALGLAQCGASVLLAARRQEDLLAVQQEIAQLGGTALAVPADVGDAEAMERLFAEVDRHFKGRLDILINNAAIGLYGDIVDFPVQDFDRLVAVNLRGAFLGCQGALRRMIPAGKGTVINVSSVVGLKGYARQAAYTATKHGILGITKSMALEAQPHNIRVSAICPGGVDTDLIRAARPDLDPSILMKPEDIARVVLFLLALPARAAIDCIYIRRFGSQPW